MRTPAGADRVGQPLGQGGRRGADDLVEGVEAAPADPGRAGPGEDARSPVVGGDDAGAGVGPEDPLVAVAGRARSSSRTTTAMAPVPWTLDGRADRGRDAGADAVGADHPRGLPGDAAPLVAADDAVDPAVLVAGTSGDRHAVAERGAGGSGGVDEDRVEHGAPRRVQRVDAVGRLDGHRDLVVGVAERRRAHGRRARGDDGVEQAPAVELHDAGAHERVGGEGVRAVAALVDDEDVEAGAGEEQGGRRAGGAGADDDDVVAWGGGVVRMVVLWGRDASGVGVRGVRRRWARGTGAGWRCGGRRGRRRGARRR